MSGAWGSTLVRFGSVLSLMLVGCGGGAPTAQVATAGEQKDELLPPPPVVKAEPERPKPRVIELNASAGAALGAGQRAFAAGDLAAAERSFREALAAQPDAHQAHVGLGAVAERRGDVGGALSQYREVLSSAPEYAPAVEAVTRLYIQSGRMAEALGYLSQLRSRAPSSAAVLAAMAELKSASKDSQAAQQLAQQALKQDPDYRGAMVVLARDHYRNRRLDLALYALTAILDGYGPENPPRDRDNPEALLLRALIYKEQNNRRGAIADLRRVVELRPDIVEARVDLAAFLLEAGNSMEAIPLLEGALAFEPANPLVHLNLGDAYRLRGRPKQALTQLEWVTQAAPKLPAPYYNIGLVYMFSKVDGVGEQAAIERAIAAFERYKSMRPRSPMGSGDDVDELLQRARHKLTIIQAMSAPGDDGFQ